MAQEGVGLDGSKRLMPHTLMRRGVALFPAIPFRFTSYPRALELK